jgi:hypothetical protein
MLVRPNSYDQRQEEADPQRYRGEAIGNCGEQQNPRIDQGLPHTQRQFRLLAVMLRSDAALQPVPFVLH